MTDDLVIAGHTFKVGETKQVKLPVAKTYTDTEVSIPLHVVRGKKPGPVFFISAAIHGDELNGIEIVRRIIQSKSIKRLKGTLIAVPMVNVYGVLNQSRYLPDRRDLNRSFPGSGKGSLAGRLANFFLKEIVEKCDYGIDLHTGAIHRSNLPQIRANLKDDETLAMAKEFGVPVLLNSDLRDGSLRQSALESGTKILLYEAGEALRFDEFSIRAGVKGVKHVLAHLGMITKRSKKVPTDPFIADSSQWIRAGTSGLVLDKKHLGDRVDKGQVLAEIGDAFGNKLDEVKSKYEGIIIGKQNIPLVQEGDAMFHVAYFDNHVEVAEHIELLQDFHSPE
ncbi:succinylglutamate desuccinylase/aspartoacylase family protein [Flocculibacter collagenilyticus]|uniref:succinylglutamate desuccinylase/aspartoacylase family protein n=1 Tax=Flocculibacter collagenilyticus TaxID=2744479 RepID=UPI0018F5E4FC|nr:succinylglutamate desuccinylase/aspartoacylase family protein [Flocculibacter collagenilyticus]